MPSARAIEGMTVYTARATGGTAKGKKRARNPKRFGVVDHVLFHPKLPHVVGFQIRRPPWLYMINRKPAFILLDEVDISGDAVLLKPRRTAAHAVEKKHGFEWERTVIWIGMPVTTRSGKQAGRVRDAVFSSAGGTVRKLQLTSGMTADLAVGTKSIDGRQVVGFDGTSVVVEDAVEESDYTGGIAKHAGRGAGVAKVNAERAARKAVAAGKAGAKVAAESEMAKKAMRGLAAFTKAAKEAMRDKDEK